MYKNMKDDPISEIPPIFLSFLFASTRIQEYVLDRFGIPRKNPTT